MVTYGSIAKQYCIRRASFSLLTCYNFIWLYFLSANKKDTEWYSVEKSRFAEEYDKDSDGRLDRSEMKSWLVPNSMETAKEEVEHLFSEADHNKDDKLSYVEIESEYNLFVGSEATNYGEHLEDMDHDEL